MTLIKVQILKKLPVQKLKKLKSISDLIIEQEKQCSKKSFALCQLPPSYLEALDKQIAIHETFTTEWRKVRSYITKFNHKTVWQLAVQVGLAKKNDNGDRNFCEFFTFNELVERLCDLSHDELIKY